MTRGERSRDERRGAGSTHARRTSDGLLAAAFARAPHGSRRSLVGRGSGAVVRRAGYPVADCWRSARVLLLLKKTAVVRSAVHSDLQAVAETACQNRRNKGVSAKSPKSA